MSPCPSMSRTMLQPPTTSCPIPYCRHPVPRCRVLKTCQLAPHRRRHCRRPPFAIVACHRPSPLWCAIIVLCHCGASPPSTIATRHRCPLAAHAAANGCPPPLCASVIYRTVTAPQHPHANTSMHYIIYVYIYYFKKFVTTLLRNFGDKYWPLPYTTNFWWLSIVVFPPKYFDDNLLLFCNQI